MGRGVSLGEEGGGDERRGAGVTGERYSREKWKGTKNISAYDLLKW